MSRITAAERMQRILNVLPWLVEHPGSTVDEVCRRFSLSPKELRDDLDLVFYNVGLHPFTPDMLAEVDIDDEERIYVRLGDYFRRPLRLSTDEALTLLAAGRAVSGRPGADPDGPLASAVEKLAAVLGDGAGDAVVVNLGVADAATLATVEAATGAHRRLRISYYSYNRDEQTVRDVDPHRVFASEGHWYLAGFCHRAGEERMFRVDRIASAEPLEAFEPIAVEARADVFDLRTAPFSAELVGGRELSWVAQAYQVDVHEVRDDASVRIVLPVTGDAWLERLLLQLDPSVLVTDPVDGSSLRPLADAAARRILRRYGATT